jgi:epoxyqueuosine reductase
VDTLDDLKQIAVQHDAALGVTDLSPFPDVAATMRRRLEDGSSANLTFTYKDPDKATEPMWSFPWGRSIVVVALPYLRNGDGPGDRSVARFADGDRYAALSMLLTEVSHRLDADGWRTEHVVDDDRLIDRAAAVRAGVGWWGKSTMVLTPGAGPWILIGSVVTDAVLAVGEPMRRTCGTCDACIPACPTGAIVAPGVLDARRCLAAMFQSRADIPRGLRSAAAGRIYGCDDCLTSCPPGSRSLEGMEPTRHELTPGAVLEMSDEDLSGVTDHWYVPGRKMRFVRRNALVALGNTGGPESVGIIMSYVEHHDAMLARHALWALSQVAPAIAVGVADGLAETASDEAMIEEIAEVVRHGT